MRRRGSKEQGRGNYAVDPGTNWNLPGAAEQQPDIEGGLMAAILARSSVEPVSTQRHLTARTGEPSELRQTRVGSVQFGFNKQRARRQLNRRLGG